MTARLHLTRDDSYTIPIPTPPLRWLSPTWAYVPILHSWEDTAGYHSYWAWEMKRIA